jgi:hypothetical protein
MFAMFIGGSAGSTGGDVKIVRWLIVGKAIRRELFTSAHPDVVQPVRLSGNVVDEWGGSACLRDEFTSRSRAPPAGAGSRRVVAVRETGVF